MSDIYDHIWSTNWNSRLMIGAGDSHHTACNGDSGGPLTVDRSQGTMGPPSVGQTDERLAHLRERTGHLQPR